MARSLARTNFVLWGWSSPKGFSWLILVIFRAIFSPNLTNFGETFGEEPNQHTGKWTRLNIRQTWPLWRGTSVRIHTILCDWSSPKHSPNLIPLARKSTCLAKILKTLARRLARNLHGSLELELAEVFAKFFHLWREFTLSFVVVARQKVLINFLF